MPALSVHHHSFADSIFPATMQSDRDRIDQLEENLNMLVGVVAQTQQQIQTLIAGMEAMRSRLRAQEMEINQLKEQRAQQ